MPKPVPGNYYIVNTETAPNSTRLAVTYNGKHAALTVTELRNQTTQEWFIAYYDKATQYISPKEATSLEVCYKGAHELTVCHAYNYVWAIRGKDDDYSIQDGRLTVFWGLQEAAVGRDVYLGVGSNSSLQNWKLIGL